MADKAGGKWKFKSIASVARFAGVSMGTIARWRSGGMPGAAENWDMQDIIRWLVRQRKIPVVDKSAAVECDDAGVSESSPALEKKREYESQLRYLDLQERRGQLVDVDALYAGLSEFAQLIRTGGESLGRTHGPDVQDALNEVLDDATESLEKAFTDGNRNRDRNRDTVGTK